MCGVFGVIDPNVSEDVVSKAVAALAHRGPDAAGVFLDGALGVGLGHRRLAIVDLETGDQPLYDHDRNIVLVCNGEIYDFDRIRAELQAEGYRFQTRSDSEVIIQLYLKYGLEFFEHLRGEFAFLLLDKTRNVLIACRDRFGIKPLFVARTNGNGWCFASEAKAIFASELKRAEIDLSNYFNENGSVFRGVYNLPPGTALTVNLSDGSFDLLTYWSPDFPRAGEVDEGKTLPEWMNETDRALTEATRLRLRADVPVGIYLSGGIDSALVAAKVCRLKKEPPLAFTVSFTDVPERYDEGSLARRIAEHLGVEHHVLELDTEMLWENLPKCLWHNEAPISDFAPVAKCLLSSLTNRHVKVVLTGEGSDEVFLGYAIFRRQLKFTTAEGLRGSLLRLTYRGANAVRERFRRGLIAALVRRRARKAEADDALERALPVQSNDRSQIEGRLPIIVLQYRRLKTNLRQVILTGYADRMEMAHSVEGRVPFLDHHLFALARQIPVRHKIFDNREKHILREMARGMVPDEVLDRRKWPFSTPKPSFQEGRYKAQDRIRARYMSRAAIRNAGVFRWTVVGVLELSRRLPLLRRYADRALIVVCCVQILHALFAEGERADLASRPRTRCEPSGAGR